MYCRCILIGSITTLLSHQIGSCQKCHISETAMTLLFLLVLCRRAQMTKDNMLSKVPSYRRQNNVLKREYCLVTKDGLLLETEWSYKSQNNTILLEVLCYRGMNNNIIAPCLQMWLVMKRIMQCYTSRNRAHMKATLGTVPGIFV